jgi:hypothetical protein
MMKPIVKHVIVTVAALGAGGLAAGAVCARPAHGLDHFFRKDEGGV